MKKPDKEGCSQFDSTQKLMVSAYICLDNECPLSTQVSRGMPIISIDGHEIGKVAAVLLDGKSRSATHILLSRLPDTKGYWSIPVDMIADVCDQQVQVRFSGNSVETLPLWHTGG